MQYVLKYFLTDKPEEVGLTHKMKNIISIKSWNSKSHFLEG